MDLKNLIFVSVSNVALKLLHVQSQIRRKETERLTNC